MSDLVNGADVPWDFVSGPREQSRHLPAARPPATVQVAVDPATASRALVRVRERMWDMALRHAEAGWAIAQRAVLRALLSGDEGDREHVRGRVTVGQVMALTSSLERGVER